MALSKTTIATVSLLSTATIGGAGVLAHNLISRETFRDKLNGTLLTSSEEDSIKWAGRADLLSKDESTTLTNTLKEIKNQSGEDKVKKIKDWCNENLNNYFSEETQLLKDIEKYCVYNIKEKLTNAIEIRTWNTDTNNQKLTNKGDEQLSKKMKEIKGKLTAQQEKDTEALKKWCESLESISFKGENDQEFKDAKEYCTS